MVKDKGTFLISKKWLLFSIVWMSTLAMTQSLVLRSALNSKESVRAKAVDVSLRVSSTIMLFGSVILIVKKRGSLSDFLRKLEKAENLVKQNWIQVEDEFIGDRSIRGLNLFGWLSLAVAVFCGVNKYVVLLRMRSLPAVVLDLANLLTLHLSWAGLSLQFTSFVVKLGNGLDRLNENIRRIVCIEVGSGEDSWPSPMCPRRQGTPWATSVVGQKESARNGFLFFIYFFLPDRYYFHSK